LEVPGKLILGQTGGVIHIYLRQGSIDRVDH
jgi:hypothetical protein